jgi:MFS family permease
VLALLRRRDFGLLWLGGLVSVAGDWVLYAALPFFVYAETGSTIATAGMIAAELTPGFLLGSVAGVFVDRWDRKRVLVVANLAQAAAVALLLFVPHGWLWMVYAVAVTQSAVAAFAMPAESALLPSLVDDEDLVAANALNALNNRLARLLGVPVGGALLAAVGLSAVVLVDCATFVVAALLIAPISGRRTAQPATSDERPAAKIAQSAWSAFWTEWREGMAIVRRERTIAIIFLVLGLMTYGGTMLDPLDVAWVRSVLGEGPQMYAALMTTHAACGIVGTLLVGRFGARWAPRHLIGWTSAVAGISCAVQYNLPVVALALAMAALRGFTSVLSSVGVETMVQRGIPDEYRGRVFGALGASGALLSLLGAATGGALAELVGIVPMLNVAAGLIVLAGLVVLRAFRDRPDAPRHESVVEVATGGTARTS